MAKRGKAIGETERMMIGAAVLAVGAFWFYKSVLGIQIRIPYSRPPRRGLTRHEAQQIREKAAYRQGMEQQQGIGEVF